MPAVTERLKALAAQAAGDHLIELRAPYCCDPRYKRPEDCPLHRRRAAPKA
jgi:hypothetical protein